MSSDGRSRPTLLESYSIAVAIKIKGAGGGNFAAKTKVVSAKRGQLLEGRCLKAYLFAIAANWDEIRKVEGLLQIASFSLLLPRSTKVSLLCYKQILKLFML